MKSLLLLSLLAGGVAAQEQSHNLYDAAAAEQQIAFAHDLYDESAPKNRRKLANADQDVVQWQTTGKWEVKNSGRTAHLPANSGGHGFIYGNLEKSSNKWYVELNVESVVGYSENGGHFGVGIKCVKDCGMCGTSGKTGYKTCDYCMWYDQGLLWTPHGDPYDKYPAGNNWPPHQLKDGNVIGILFDADSDTLQYSLNGQLLPVVNTDNMVFSGTWKIAIGDGTSGNNGITMTIRNKPMYTIPKGFNYWTKFAPSKVSPVTLDLASNEIQLPKSIDFATYNGVRVNSDNGMFCMGKNKDACLFRTGDGVLQMSSTRTHVPGKLWLHRGSGDRGNLVKWVPNTHWKTMDNDRTAHLPRTAGGKGFVYGDIDKESGKWYVDIEVAAVQNYEKDGGHFGIGMKCTKGCAQCGTSGETGYGTCDYLMWYQKGLLWTSHGGGYDKYPQKTGDALHLTKGNVIGIKFDADANTLEFYLNGKPQGLVQTDNMVFSGAWKIAVGDGTSGDNGITVRILEEAKYGVPKGFNYWTQSDGWSLEVGGALQKVSNTMSKLHAELEKAKEINAAMYRLLGRRGLLGSVMMWTAANGWDLSMQSSRATLSAKGGGFGFMQADSAKDTGKWYVDVAIENIESYVADGGHFGIGIKCVSGCGQCGTKGVTGYGTCQYVMWYQKGLLWTTHGGGYDKYPPGGSNANHLTKGNTIGIAFNGDANSVEFFLNGKGQGKVSTDNMVFDGQWVVAIGDGTSGNNGIQARILPNAKYKTPKGFTYWGTIDTDLMDLFGY